MTDQEKTQDQPSAESETTEETQDQPSTESEATEETQDQSSAESETTEETQDQSSAESVEEETAQRSQTSEQLDRLKETTEKLWGNTRSAWSTATSKANQYKKLVQMKIDQSALHKKINAAHTDLGKMIDDLREAGKKSIMNQAEVKGILAKIDELKAESATLEEAVARIKADSPQEEAQEEEKPS
ncbi:MAG: hypothetical protein DRH08_13055 [Deltaproteobacteria bacterium]|nr:MAG: hypothetical protein DRH08_13055 [Deltaproteobacteria bacterium]